MGKLLQNKRNKTPWAVSNGWKLKLTWLWGKTVVCKSTAAVFNSTGKCRGSRRLGIWGTKQRPARVCQKQIIAYAWFAPSCPRQRKLPWIQRPCLHNGKLLQIQTEGFLSSFLISTTLHFSDNLPEFPRKHGPKGIGTGPLTVRPHTWSRLWSVT